MKMISTVRMGRERSRKMSLFGELGIWVIATILFIYFFIA